MLEFVENLQINNECEESGCCVLCDRVSVDLNGVLINHVFAVSGL